MKKLQAKYKDRDVLFLAIHTAGADIEQIRDVQRRLKWDSAVGLDDGDDISSGKTAQAYGVQGYPNVIIIGRDGRVAFNDADQVERDKELAYADVIEQALTGP